MKSEDYFAIAARDYHYLLCRGYDSAGSRDFVGNRYQLRGEQRSMLYRGIFSRDESNKRRLRLADAGEVTEKNLHIDAANVLFTIASYLDGRKVFIATDGLLRDAAEMHSKTPGVKSLQSASRQMLHSLAAMHPAALSFYLNEKMPALAVLCQEIERSMKGMMFPVEYESFPKPDLQMVKMQNGILATADSSLINRSSLPVFDLAAYVLKEKFSASFLDLSYLNA
ncbi:MAG: DUF434 domain-containing protein [Bacteroidota bacterium]|nr:DUF434 domain-containing protein [Bacteroidota bacterium]